LPLFDGTEEIVRRIPGEVLADVEHLDAVDAQDVPVVARFVVVEATEALDVVDDDEREGAALLLGLVHHLQESWATMDARTTDGVVDEEVAEVEAVFLGLELDRLPLVGQGLFLAIGRAADVADGHLGGRPVSGAGGGSGLHGDSRGAGEGHECSIAASQPRIEAQSGTLGMS